MRDGASINAGRLAPADLGLYAVTVFVWGTSWIALKAQLGEVSPEVSTLWRFLLAAPLMWLWAAARGEALAYPAADHRRFAAAGALMFSSNFVLFLYGGQYLPSGLLAVVFSLVSPEPPPRRGLPRPADHAARRARRRARHGRHRAPVLAADRRRRPARRA